MYGSREPGFNRGDVVVFGRPNGEKTVGTIVRVNAKTYTIETLEARGRNGRSAAGKKWRVAKSLVRLRDRTLVLPPRVDTPVSVPKARDKETILRELRRIESGLEPENLFCDGERSRTAARKVERKLLRERKTLISELGYTPNYSEVWGNAY